MLDQFPFEQHKEVPGNGVVVTVATLAHTETHGGGPSESPAIPHQ